MPKEDKILPGEVQTLMKKVIKVNVEILMLSIVVFFILNKYAAMGMFIIGNIAAVSNLIIDTVVFPQIFKADDEKSKASKNTKYRYWVLYISKILLFIILVINIKIDKNMLIPLVCGYAINLIAIVITVFKAGYKTTQ